MRGMHGAGRRRARRPASSPVQSAVVGIFSALARGCSHRVDATPSPRRRARARAAAWCQHPLRRGLLREGIGAPEHQGAMTSLPVRLQTVAAALSFALSPVPVVAASSCTSYADTDFQCSSGSAPDCDIFQIVNVPSATACCAACAVNATCWAAAYNLEKTCYFKGKGALPTHRDATQGCSCKGKPPAAPPAPPNLCAAGATAGYSASVIARSVGPEAGSSLISKANGTSDLEFNCEPSTLRCLLCVGVRE